MVALLVFVPAFSVVSFTASAQPEAVLVPPAVDYGQDDNSDGFFDFLVIEITIEVYVAGEYSVGVDLNDSLGEHIYGYHATGWFFGVGTHVVTMPFDGIIISGHGLDGPYEIWAQLRQYPSNVLMEEFTDFTEPYTVEQFEALPAEFGPVYGSMGIDVDGNGRYEFFQIDFQVEALVAKEYQIRYSIIWYAPPDIIYFADAEVPMFLDVGTSTQSISIRGSGINAGGVNGPYQIYLALCDRKDDVQRYLDDLFFYSDGYSYTDFESGSISSPHSSSAPAIDGVFSEGEWSDATVVDMGRSDMGNPFGADMLVKNSETHLYICLDAVADLTEDAMDNATIAFDSGNDNEETGGLEDQFMVHSLNGLTIHKIYSQMVSNWVDHCEPFNPMMPAHQGLEGASGFGPSDGMAADHRIYEFSIPLELVGAQPGSVIGFAANGNDCFGIYDDTRKNGTSWPYYLGPKAPLTDYGDLALGYLPIATTASPSGTLGSAGWYVSPVTVTLTAAGGALGLDFSRWNLDSTTWVTYSSPFACAADGNHTVQYYSFDQMSNREATKSLSFSIDQTRPSSTATMADRNLTLAASDATSGVKSTSYRVDGGAWEVYTVPVEISGEVNHTVEYYSVDNAGNTEETKTLTVEKEEEKEVEDGDGGGGGSILGFEFFIVLAIIAIILAISIPKLFGMRRKAKESDSKAAIKDIGTAMMQMQDDTSPKKEPSSTEEKPPEKPGG